MEETSGLVPISTRLKRIAWLARQLRKQPLTTLAHHIDLEWLREAHRRTRKDGARGVDGQSADDYAAHLEDNLRSLLERAKSGTYRAPPVRRVHIPKVSGSETRPIGIPTFEDKVLQRAVAMVLEAVYEEEFLDCSYGFRPGRSAQQALDELHREAMRMAGGWVIEIDIRKYFDSIDHERLGEVLRRRIRDGAILRLIGKWLNAGVLEDRNLKRPDAGSPQGGVVSPILANVLLHEVFDVWFAREVRPRMRGRAHLVRYADDAVMLFEYEEDARRVMAVLPKRFGKYGLTLHPDKTRLLPFKRPDRMMRRRDADEGPYKPATFDFLGFTIHWGKSLAGKWAVKTRTASDRFQRALNGISQWCKAHRHEPIERQQHVLNLKLRGHYGYYGRPGNRARLWTLLHWATRVWWRWLHRRSQRGLSWAAMNRLLKRYPLLKPTAVRIV
ncbi:group II intron reverse transcriptase/maturase [Sorangium sp. So ce1000]|uniref:group II intron reverse transcriptase/maturase n=1 Tax=Sorangium sp. So ce1000 TaxID=3133325 RepID=UPI003F619F1B